ncbi:TraR/DksA C4-type zinc finger protein [Clostridiaceae bacterium M8S5]|nr:TraR/DksA C4-type zinc finger protein [Clostridiaceae bacterium M8S5]
MNKSMLHKYKIKLQQERDKILSTINEINKNDLAGALKESGSELSSYDNHPADLGTETFMMEQSMNLKENEVNLLSNIDNALENIKEGKYGVCKICGKDIKEERLDILPYVDTCTHCMDKTLASEVQYRPIEESVIGYPFSRIRSMAGENVEVDGEDVYQDVEKYNKMPLDPDQIGDFDDFKSGVLEGTQKIEQEEDIFK